MPEQQKPTKEDIHGKTPPPPPSRNPVPSTGPARYHTGDSGISEMSVVHDLVPYPPPAPPRSTSKTNRQIDEKEEEESKELPVYGNAEPEGHK